MQFCQFLPIRFVSYLDNNYEVECDIGVLSEIKTYGIIPDGLKKVEKDFCGK